MTSKAFPCPQQPMYQDERIRRSPPGRDILGALNNLGILFAKRPLALSESEQDYDKFLMEISAAVEPKDVIEKLWVKDFVDLKWETMRLRRIQASLLMGAAKAILADQLRMGNAGTIDGGQVFTLPDLLTGFADGDDKAVAEVERVMALRGKDWDMIMAQALVEKLDQVGPIERMIVAAGARQSRLLQEIDRRRDAFARRLRAVRNDASGQ
jgi:hypothetical protein